MEPALRPARAGLCVALVALTFLPAAATEKAASPGVAAPFDLLILNGRVLDGAGNPWRQEDVGIRAGRIAALGRLEHALARRRIDAAGRFVAPGFIDLLGQSETTILADGRLWSKAAQGITTELSGEASSPAPQNESTRRHREHREAALGVRVDWADLEEYYARLERQKIGVNFGTYVSVNQVRQTVLGGGPEPATPQQLDTMIDHAALSMRQGAFGVSSSLIYPPGSYAGVHELTALAEAAGRLGGLYLSHIRNESDGIGDALTEAITIGLQARLPVEIWHLKVAGPANWGKMPQVVARIEEARREGLDIKADVYPYVASGTTLSACIPPWAQEGGAQAYLERLRDAGMRQRIKEEMVAPESSRWDNGWLGSGDGERVMLADVYSERNRPLRGKRISEIAALRKADPRDVVLDLILEEEDRADAYYFEMSEDDLRFALRQPWVSIITDAEGTSREGALGRRRPHPRAYGSFPRVLGRYVREEKILSWEEAVRKMTSLPASKIGLHERGLVRRGFWADLVVFDPQTIADRATFESPDQDPAGIDFVIVNGEIVVEAGRHTGLLPGRVLRGPAFAAGSRR